MPHIFLSGCDTNRQIGHINIHVELHMNPALYKNLLKRNVKVAELSARLNRVLLEYFDDVSEPEYIDNHEYNKTYRQ